MNGMRHSWHWACMLSKPLDEVMKKTVQRNASKGVFTSFVGLVITHSFYWNILVLLVSAGDLSIYFTFWQQDLWTMGQCLVLWFFKKQIKRNSVFCFPGCTDNIMNPDPKTMLRIQLWVLCKVTALINWISSPVAWYLWGIKPNCSLEWLHMLVGPQQKMKKPLPQGFV